MKVTEPELIEELEEGLFQAVKESLDRSAVSELLRERLNVSGFSCNKGDMVVHDGKVAYSLDLSLTVDLKILMDRSGNLIRD